MDDERFVTSLLHRFSDPNTGWILVRNTGSLIFVTEFIRLFESFIRQSEPGAPRRLKQIPWLKRTVLRCLDSWNILRNQDAPTTEDIATVELIGDHLTNVEVIKKKTKTRILRKKIGFGSIQRGRGGARRHFTRGKRDFGPQRFRRNNFPKQHDVPMKGEIAVRNEIAGAIIGRKGKTVSNVRAASGSHVHVCECKDGWSRVIEIYGTKDQVMEAYRQLNLVIKREYPDYLRKKEMIEMITTVELKMGIALATYLTGINGSLVADIQEKTGVVTTLHGVDGEEDSKKVRLTGNIDNILDSHHAVMAILDTYEEWKVANTINETENFVVQEGSFQGAAMETTPLEDHGDAFQSSSVFVLQPDGSYKEMQIWVQPSPSTAPSATPASAQIQTSSSSGGGGNSGILIGSSNALTSPALMTHQDPHLTFPYATNYHRRHEQQSISQSGSGFSMTTTAPKPLGKISSTGASQQQPYHHGMNTSSRVEEPGKVHVPGQGTRPLMMTGPESGLSYCENPASVIYNTSNFSTAAAGGGGGGGSSTSQYHLPEQGQVIILPSETHSIVYNSDEMLPPTVTSTAQMQSSSFLPSRMMPY